MSEFGWVMEHKDSEPSVPSYFDAAPWSLDRPYPWTNDNLKAIRFARKEDAQKMATYLKLDHVVRICEHGWGL